jgi:hypothetical protein
MTGRYVCRRLGGSEAVRGSETGVEVVGGVFLVRNLSSQDWTQTLPPAYSRSANNRL